jgi:hypothetical protein
MKTQKKFASVAIAALFVLLACARANDKMPIDVHRAIEIADGSVKSNGIDRASLELVTAKQYVTPQNDVVPKNPTSARQRDLAKKLDGRSYWYVYYISPGAEMGGDVGVFIDARTGDVIDIYRGR